LGSSQATIKTLGSSQATIKTLDSSQATIKTLGSSQATIKTLDSSQATIKTLDSSQATIKTRDSSQATIKTLGSSQATIETWESANIRDDLWAVLCSYPSEILTLREALLAGLINGKVYEGDCACLVGTIAKTQGVHFKYLKSIKPNGNRPAELWFWNIKTGDTPSTNKFSALALKWIDELLTNWGIEVAA
jgi:hypothetical protein